MLKINYTFTFGFLFGFILVIFIGAINFNFIPEWVTSVATATAMGVSTSLIATFKKQVS